jgi:uncharacterized protein (UPF0548 family)
VFFTHRPNDFEIEKFISASRDLPLSYDPVGIVKKPPHGFNVDTASSLIGRGAEAFARARSALSQWQHFELGWVELFPRSAPIEPGATVAVLIHHLGLWSLNGCRIVYSIGADDAASESFGFAYGTLTNHAELGEESFEVSLNRASGEVTYRICAVSKPRAAWARMGYPYVRFCQSRFRQDSLAAMRRAIGSP